MHSESESHLAINLQGLVSSIAEVVGGAGSDVQTLGVALAQRAHRSPRRRS